MTEKRNNLKRVSSIATWYRNGGILYYKIRSQTDLAVNVYESDNKISYHISNEMCVLTDGHAPKPSEANSHAKLSHSKQLLKTIHTMMLTQFY